MSFLSYAKYSQSAALSKDTLIRCPGPGVWSSATFFTFRVGKWLIIKFNKYKFWHATLRNGQNNEFIYDTELLVQSRVFFKTNKGVFQLINRKMSQVKV